MISELMDKLWLSVAVGVALGVVAAASPLTLVAIVAGLVVLIAAERGLPPGERRRLRVLLTAALLVRALIIVALFVRAIPHLNDLAVGSLSGDDAYYLGRAIRVRDLVFGFAATKYDYFVVLTDYGRTRYLDLLALIQMVLGPTPFAMRLLNAVFFIAGAAMLFRVARRAFGPTPALVGLFLLLFMPSLLWTSISLLKESLYFLCASALVYCCDRVVRARTLGSRVVLAGQAAVALWLLSDLRREALVLAGGGIALAIVLYFVCAKPRRAWIAAALALSLALAAIAQPSWRSKGVSIVEQLAQIHGGHVFTVGHPYKLLEDEFYVNPAAPGSWDLFLTPPQAARYLFWSAVTFLVTPLPWQMVSLGELMFLPEQLFWYALLLMLPFGVVAGWRRDRATTSLLLAFAIPIAAALALTNGNVGTLLRLRGLVMPYLLWLATLGALSMLDRAQPASRFETAV